MAFEISEKFRSLFPDVRYPIIQAPMAGTATPEMAAAVSNAGALGSIGIGLGTPELAHDLITRTHALTDRPFHVNFFCHQPPYRDVTREIAWLNHLQPLFDELEVELPTILEEVGKSFIVDDDMLQVVLETRPPVVSFHFGLPHPHQLVAIREAGITTLATATSLTDAQEIVAAGIDGIVAQGIEAGGHRGIIDFKSRDEELPTSVLVRILAQNIDTPVIAAGGIMDGCGIRSALDNGAVAAQLGTAFILCPESSANEGYRAALKSERAHATALTPVLSGRPARGLFNRYVGFCESPGSPAPADYPLTNHATRLLVAAAKNQAISGIAAHWAGQGAPLIREMPANELIATLMGEFHSA